MARRNRNEKQSSACTEITHALRSSSEHAALEEMVMAQGLGDAGRQALRNEKGNRRPGATAGRDFAPYLG
jgi:hypothetical protein